MLNKIVNSCLLEICALLLMMEAGVKLSNRTMLKKLRKIFIIQYIKKSNILYKRCLDLRGNSIIYYKA